MGEPSAEHALAALRVLPLLLTSVSMKPLSQSTVTQLTRNSGCIAGSRLMMALVTLLAMPVFVYRLGWAGYGVWEIVLTITGFNMLWQGPMGGTLLWAASNAYGNGDQARVRELVRIGVFANLVLTSFLLLPIFFSRNLLPALLHVPLPQQPQVALVLPAVLASALASGIGDSYAAVIDGCQRMGLTALVRAGAHLVGTAVSLSGVLTGHGLYSLAFGQWSAAVVSWGSFYVLARMICPSVRFGVCVPSGHDARRLSSYAALLFVGYLSAVFRDQTDKLVLAAFAKPVWVGYYTMSARLTSLVLELCKLVYGPTVGLAGVLYARADAAGLKALYSGLMTWLPPALGAGVLLIGGLHRELVVVWFGRPVPEVTPIVLLLLGGNAAAGMLTGAGTAICRGIGRVSLETRYVIVGLISNIALTVVLVGTTGAMGTVWASAISWAGSSLYFARLLPAKLDFPAAPAVRAGIVLSISVTFAGLLLWFSDLFSPVGSRLDTLMLAASLAAPALVVYAVVLFASGLLPSETVSRWSPNLFRRGRTPEVGSLA